MDDQAPIKVRKNSGKYTTEGKLYCVCRQSYDATRFMIACDRCDDWFHGECININEKESEFIDLYFCTKCSKSKFVFMCILLKKKLINYT